LRQDLVGRSRVRADDDTLRIPCIWPAEARRRESLGRRLPKTNVYCCSLTKERIYTAVIETRAPG